MVSFSIDSTHSLLVKSQEVEKCKNLALSIASLSNIILATAAAAGPIGPQSSRVTSFNTNCTFPESSLCFWLKRSLLAQMITSREPDQLSQLDAFSSSRRQWGNKTNGTRTNFHKSQTWSPFLGALYLHIQSNPIWDDLKLFALIESGFWWSYQILLILLLLH